MEHKAQAMQGWEEMNIKSAFAYHLDFLYPKGKACMFYPEKYKWSELCHIQSGGDINRKLCERAFGNGDFIDMPLLNLIPGSQGANDGQYKTTVEILPDEVVKAARMAIVDYNIENDKSGYSKTPISLPMFDEATRSLSTLLKFHEYFAHTMQLALLARVVVLDLKEYKRYGK